MICFPNCKINLGLYITGKRDDGFHNLETVFYPVNWCDALEVIEHPKGKDFELELSGDAINVPPEQNILHKAWLALRSESKVPPVLVHLLKKIPSGAGLGGGSSNAAFFLKLLNQRFSLGLPTSRLRELALSLGSDCPFFIDNQPAVARGRGELLSHIDLNLSRYYLILIFPGIHSNTAEAFKHISPRRPEIKPEEVISGPVNNWKDRLINDFEPALFQKYPLLKSIKDNLYEAGALYASMSGSGSTMFGIFEHAPPPSLGAQHLTHIQKPVREIL